MTYHVAGGEVLPDDVEKVHFVLTVRLSKNNAHFLSSRYIAYLSNILNQVRYCVSSAVF